MSLSHDASYWHDATNRDWPTWPEQLPPLDEDEVANAATWADTKRPQLQSEIRARGNRTVYRFRDETPERVVIEVRRADFSRPLVPMSEDDCRRHLASLSNQHHGCSAPSLPLNIRRRKKNLLTRLVDAIIAALP